MREVILKYLNETFPNLQHQVYIRFELGKPYENGTDARLAQVNKRVKSIFNHLFQDDDDVFIFIVDWMQETEMFGNTTADHLYEILKDVKIESSIVERKTDEADTERFKIRESFVHAKRKDIDFSAVFSGIANYEQGREPSIGQEVYIINKHKNLLFKMYDDRGCIVYSNKFENLNDLYIKCSDWVIDYCGIE